MLLGTCIECVPCSVGDFMCLVETSSTMKPTSLIGYAERRVCRDDSFWILCLALRKMVLPSSVVYIETYTPMGRPFFFVEASSYPTTFTNWLNLRMHSQAEPTKWVSAPPSTMAKWFSTVANLLMKWMLALTTQVLTWRLVCIISRHVCTLSSAELSMRRFAIGYCRGRVGLGGTL